MKKGRQCRHAKCRSSKYKISLFTPRWRNKNKKLSCGKFLTDFLKSALDGYNIEGLTTVGARIARPFQGTNFADDQWSPLRRMLCVILREGEPLPYNRKLKYTTNPILKFLKDRGVGKGKLFSKSFLSPRKNIKSQKILTERSILWQR